MLNPQEIAERYDDTAISGPGLRPDTARVRRGA
jgi:hypothetical protein